MVTTSLDVAPVSGRRTVSGEFVDLTGERYYAIRNVDLMPPFFVSVVSSADHWLFVSSTGGLTAGRVSPETALFPYVTVDKIHDSAAHTGCKTLLRVASSGTARAWEPFNREHDDRYALSCHLYKSLLGNKICFEEINHDLQLRFRYTWMFSEQYGFVRHCELKNLGDRDLSVDLVDGLQNILPAGTPRFAQTNTSNLVDAYKWTELDEPTGLAMFTLYSGITDRAAPCESLKANTVFCLGLEGHTVLISSAQLDEFRQQRRLSTETCRRGVRGTYLVSTTVDLAPGGSRQWQIVGDVEQSQSQVVGLIKQLADPARIGESIAGSVDQGSDELARIVAASDGFQAAAEEHVAVHHYANVLFNVLRGGVFIDQYRVASRNFAGSVGHFNRAVHQRNRALLDSLPETLDFARLRSTMERHGDPQLERLCYEYMPITFGRRHGDPSRPWNQFRVKLTDESGNRVISYQGNWRDIFQNWEALALSFPDFIENMIAKFVNASTVDGYNPYRITDEGIDWEVEEPDDPWSYIGYWGDHQIVYLLKLLELSEQFHPARLAELLHRSIFCYANVPYRIKPFAALLDDPKNTVTYDEALAERIARRVARIGADGKLLLDTDEEVYRVSLLEKLLVPLLAKLANLVIDGGVWMNTQRPEWNDANNALVGQGLSMVTLYYLRRYVRLLKRLLAAESEELELSGEVSQWLTDTADALGRLRPMLNGSPISSEQRYRSLVALGEAASRYRETVYAQQGFSGTVTRPLDGVLDLLDDALAVIDHSIGVNRREDGLYHAYNLLDLNHGAAELSALYPMLEGQVAALSSGLLAPSEAAAVVDALFLSDVYRPDQHSFMLYPDRPLPGFLSKNRVPDERIRQIPLLERMLAEGDERIILRDPEGSARFSAEFTNGVDLNDRLSALAAVYGDELEAARQDLEELFEDVFNHQAFTGRSGGMFGFEGLGCVYWHMVAKLLLAVQENFFSALEAQDQRACQRLGALYYRVRDGIGFNKSPAEFGAFPTDPYSHTPKHAGAQQPGMTGQVKEEILTRFGELGIRVIGGAVEFKPDLLRACEFVSEPRQFCFLDVDGNWQDLTVAAAGLAFTWCQVPVVYRLIDSGPSVTVTLDSGETQTLANLALPPAESSELFRRSGRIRRLEIALRADMLFAE